MKLYKYTINSSGVFVDDIVVDFLYKFSDFFILQSGNTTNFSFEEASYTSHSCNSIYTSNSGYILFSFHKLKNKDKNKLKNFYDENILLQISRKNY